MGMYSSALGGLKRDLVLKEELEKEVNDLNNKLASLSQDYLDMVNAQRLLAAISDDNTEAALNFITGVVNKTLSEIFKSDTRKITLKKKLYAGARPHIVVELTNGRGETIDMNLQSGTGLKQIVSGLFTICLVEIRKGRRLVIFDERFSGLHKEAKEVLSEILKIFAEGGFQFIFVEYALNNIGNIYNVEKPGAVARAYPLNGQDYNDSDVFIFSGEADLSILDKDFQDDTEEDLAEEYTI